jgi:hypothetical protein
MKKLILNTLASAIMAVALTACGGSGGGFGSCEISMTTNVVGTVELWLVGNGTATIDWGDGSKKIKLPLREGATKGNISYAHTYISPAVRTIIVSGGNITGLRCSGMNLKSLDVSKNTELTWLRCENNQLIILDLTKNTK